MRLLASLRVWQLMRAGPLVVAADQPLVEATRLTKEHRADVLAVVDGHGRPVGIIATDDLIHALTRHPHAGPASTDGGQEHVVQVAAAELSEAQTAVILAMNRAGMPSCLHERLSWPSGLRLASFIEVPV